MMPATIHVQIKNLDEIRAAFLKSPLKMTKNLNIAIAKSVTGIEKDSRINTPRDTGTLMRSHRSKLTNLKGEVSTNTEYDVFVHEGTRFMKARPYLKRAVDSNAESVSNEFEYAVQKTLDEIARDIR